MTAPEDELLAEARPSEGMTLIDLARELPGKASVEGGATAVVCGVQHDSRRVAPGDLFVVREGQTHDGRAFVAAAIARGAAAVLAADDLALEPPGVPVVRVADVADGFAYAAAAVYGHPTFSLDVVGITGTNGKTTSSHLVRAAIDGALGLPLTGVVGTVGHTYAGRTIAASHTTPEADELARVLAVMRKRGATHVAMEVSSIALVLRRVAAVRFRVAAFTNLTQDHLDFHGSMEAYAAAKLELFTKMGPGLAVVNVDDPLGPTVAATAKCKVLRVRARPGAADAEVLPESVETSGAGMRVVLRVPGAAARSDRDAARRRTQRREPGVAIASSRRSSSTSSAPRRLASEGAPGSSKLRLTGTTSWCSSTTRTRRTPSRALDAVRGADGGKRVGCVFGGGGDRDSSKRRPMGEAVGAGADVAIVTSDNPRTEDPARIAEPVVEGVAGGLPRASAADVARGARGFFVELDRRAAIAAAIAAAQPGDVVLVAGKGHEDYHIVGREKRAFDDRIEARDALELRRRRDESEA